MQRLSVLLSFLAAISASSKTVVVDSTVSSLSSAVNALSPGDTLLLRGGIYNKSITISAQGTEERKITIKNYPGEVPILQGPAGNTSGGIGGSNVRGIRLQGLVVRKWYWSGIGFGWDTYTRSVEIRYCVADSNGPNGIQVANLDSTLVEYCIASRNGSNPANSWSSGLDFIGSGSGKNNVCRNCVAFNNVDVSAAKSDGMGIIMDSGDSLAGITFENNISFANGGAGIAVTRTANVRIIGNTSYNNFLDSDLVYTYGALSIANYTAAVKNNIIVMNNVLIQNTGRGCTLCNFTQNGFTNSVFSNNFQSTNPAGDTLFRNADNGDFRLRGAPAVVTGQGAATGVYPTDNGFDPRCVKKADGQTIAWWRYAPDIDYIIARGGLENCFTPVNRGAAIDLGAYAKDQSSTRCASSAPRVTLYDLHLVPGRGAPVCAFTGPAGQRVTLEIYAVDGTVLFKREVRARGGAIEYYYPPASDLTASGLYFAVMKRGDRIVAAHRLASAR